MKAVHLVLKHQYYDAIDNGEKTVEYRDNTDYWRKRILGKHRSGMMVATIAIFHRGYTNQTMSFLIDYLVVPKPHEVDQQIEIHLGKRMN